MFVLMPSWGLSNAAATLVGQNLGAGQPERAEASAWRACWFNVAVLGVLGVLFVVFADVVVGWFTHDPDVAPIATLGLRIISGGFPFYAAGYVLTQSFNGAGDTCDADADQPRLLLVVRDSAVVRAGAIARLRPARRVLGDGDRVFGDVDGERVAVSPRDVEAETRVEPDNGGYGGNGITQRNGARTAEDAADGWRTSVAQTSRDARRHRLAVRRSPLSSSPFLRSSV